MYAPYVRRQIGRPLQIVQMASALQVKVSVRYTGMLVYLLGATATSVVTYVPFLVKRYSNSEFVLVDCINLQQIMNSAIFSCII